MMPTASLAISVAGAVGTIFSLDTVYIATGIVLFVFAWFTWTDRQNRRRRTSAIFWAILGVIFAFGTWMPHWLTGVLVLGMVVMDGAHRVAPGTVPEPTAEEQRAGADRLRHRIFVPVLTIPLVTIVFALVAARLGADVTRAALVGLGLGGVIAMLVCLRITGGGMQTMVEHGRRLNDAIGTVTILPQLLASLGVIFAAAKVGDLIAVAIQHIIPPGRLFLLVLANCLGMALFTIVMGNSFAAFPVILTGVLAPLIIQPFGVDPAMAGIITLTAGSSGTLMTPMAANFNIVPTALLNMRDSYGVIRFQLPFGVIIWSAHVVLLWALIRLTAHG